MQTSTWVPQLKGLFSKSDSVRLLPGCGPVKSSTLAALGIYTIQDLMDYNSSRDPSGLVSKFKVVARERLRVEEDKPFILKNPPTELPKHIITVEDHSWFGKVGHVEFESAGPVVRVRIGAFLVTPYGALLRVSSMSRRKVRTRIVSPLLLASMHTLWVRAEILSEEEATEAEEDDDVPSPPPKDSEELPFFTLNLEGLLETLTSEHRDMIRLSVREVQSFQRRSVLTLMLGPPPHQME